MSSPSSRDTESDTNHQIAIHPSTNQHPSSQNQVEVILEDSNNRTMSPTPTIHVLHDPHDCNDDDVQMISEFDRKSGLIRQTQPLLNCTMSPTATMTSTSPSGAGTAAAATATVLLKRQHSNNSNSSGSEEFLQIHHQLLYQRSLSLSHSQELLGSTAPYSIQTATRRASAFTPYTNLQLQQQHLYHRGSHSTSGFSGHGSSSVSSPLSTCSRHSITPPTVLTSTPMAMQLQHLKSPNPAAMGDHGLDTGASNIANAGNEAMCSLKWKDYEAEVLDTLGSLYKSEEWADVTLSCEGHTIKAHKAILAMCSPFFRKMFQESPCKHPHVIVNGMKRREFERVIHFIYNGHVAINPDDLDDFLDAAESLKIDGVHGGGWAAHSPDGPSEHEQEHERDQDDAEYSLNPGSMYTHRLHRHRRHSSQSRSISDEYEHSLPVPFERLHLEEGDPDHRERLHARRSSSGSSFERDERATDDTMNSMKKEKEDNEQVVVADEPDKDQKYPLNRLPKFQFKHRRHIGSGDEGKESGSSGRERRSTSSSISSGDTVVSSKTILDRVHGSGRPGSGETCFEQISPPSTPDPNANADDEGDGDAPSTSKSLRLDTQYGGADYRASPVDMSVGSRSSILGPRPPPPPWYSPPSYKSQDESRRSRHSSDDDSIIEKAETGTSGGSGRPSSLNSPPYAAVITNPSRASHFSQRHSLSHIYVDAGVGIAAGAGRLGVSGDESFMRRSLSLSPPENQSYQLHLPERRDLRDEYNGPYSRAIDVMNSSSNRFSSRKNFVPGTHLEDRRWMIHAAAAATGKHPIEIPMTGVQRFSQQAKEPINAAAFQFRGFGSPSYSTAATTSSPSILPLSKSPLYGSGGDERNLSLQNYSALMESAGALGHLSDFQKYRFKTTNSGFGFGAGSQLRMQLTHSGADSVGSSTRASSSSSSASLGGGHSSQGQFNSSAPNHSHSRHQSMTASGSHRPGMNHSLSSLTKPRTKAIRSCQVPQEFRYTAQEVDSMVERVENYPGPLVPCAVCAKFVKRERLRAHIHECHLLQGEKIICQYCGIALKSKGSYRVHIWRHKRGNLPTKKFKPGTVARRPSGQNHSEAAAAGL